VAKAELTARGPAPADDGRDFLRARAAAAKTRLGRAAIGGALVGLIFLALWALAPPAHGRDLSQGRKNVFAWASFVGFVVAGFCLIPLLANPTRKRNARAFDDASGVVTDYVESFEGLEDSEDESSPPGTAETAPPAAAIAPEALPPLPALESRLVRVRWGHVLSPLALVVLMILSLIWMPDLAGRFALVGAAAVAAFVINARQASFQYSLAKKAALVSGKATGFVLANRMGYEFEASDGHTYTGDIRMRSSPGAPKPGSPVFVLYDPQDPNRNLPLPRLNRVEIGMK
jgi:hypothetical protein